ncbi:hypothetical protein ACUXLG_005966 [Ralstonia sp. 121560039-2]|jgi:hypothetical protein
MGYSVDVFQNSPPNNRWTGVVKAHPTDGGPGAEVHRASGYVSEGAAEIGCERAITRHEASIQQGG